MKASALAETAATTLLFALAGVLAWNFAGYRERVTVLYGSYQRSLVALEVERELERRISALHTQAYLVGDDFQRVMWGIGTALRFAAAAPPRPAPKASQAEPWVNYDP